MICEKTMTAIGEHNSNGQLLPGGTPQRGACPAEHRAQRVQHGDGLLRVVH